MPNWRLLLLFSIAFLLWALGEYLSWRDGIYIRAAMTTRALQLLNDDVKPCNPTFLIVFYTCFSLKIEFIKLIMLHLLLNGLLQKVIYWLILFKYVLNIEFLPFVKSAELIARLMLEVVCQKYQWSLLIKIEEYFVWLANIFLI